MTRLVLAAALVIAWSTAALACPSWMSSLTGCTTASVSAYQARIPLSRYGAASNGSADVSSALNAAITDALAGSPHPAVYVPSGQYLLNGTATVNLNHVTLVCEGQNPDGISTSGGGANAKTGSQGAVFWLASASVTPFYLGAGSEVRGCTFYWPNQTATPTGITVGNTPFSYANGGSLAQSVNITGGAGVGVTINGVAQPFTSGTFNLPAGQGMVVSYTPGSAPTMAYWQPTVYPPLFSEGSNGTIVNARLIGDHWLNAYDVLAPTSDSDPMGDITVRDSYGYAIHNQFTIAYVTEFSRITGGNFDVTLGQGIDPSPYYMRSWTANNGAFLDIPGNATSQAAGGIAGLLVSHVGIFGERYGIHVENSGELAGARIDGIWDGVATPLQVDASGCIQSTKLDGEFGAFVVNWTHGLWSASDLDADPLVSLDTSSGCSTQQLAIAGSFWQAQGDVLDIAGSGVGSVDASFPASNTYGRSAAAGTYYFANIASSATGAILDLHNSVIHPAASGASWQGVDIQGGTQINLAADTFEGVYNPVTIGSPSISVIGSGLVALASPSGSAGVAGAGDSALALLASASNSWDLAARPTPSSCGTSPSVTAGNDAQGLVTVGSGTVTSCTLALAYAPGSSPLDASANDTAAGVYASANSGGSITFSAIGGTNLAGTTLAYSIRPAH